LELLKVTIYIAFDGGQYNWSNATLETDLFHPCKLELEAAVTDAKGEL